MTTQSLMFTIKGIVPASRVPLSKWNWKLTKARASYAFRRKFEPFVTPCGYPIEHAQQLTSWWEIAHCDYLFRDWPALMPQRPTILDIGANYGIFAWECRKRFPNATIIGFEPIPEAAKFCRDLEVYDDFFEVALSNHVGTANLMIESSRGLTATIERVHTAAESIIEVNSVRLDKVFHGRADFIKMDVDGGELLVIGGGIDTFIKSRACQVECVTKDRLHQVENLLGRKSQKLSTFDYLFIK